MSDALVMHVVCFGRVLREAGLEIGPGRLSDALAGLDAVDLTRQDDVYWTLRTTLVSQREELAAFDRAFGAWFLRAPVRPEARAEPKRPPEGQHLQRTRTEGRLLSAAESADADPTEIGWSAHEILRRKDFGAMTPEELARARAEIAELAATRPTRRSRRLRRHHRGHVVDLRGMVRASLATGGDPLERRYRRRLDVPRKLVALCDVSGSMEAYARPLLLFLHTAVGSGRGVEAFAFGTRLTRLTPDLRTRDPERALADAAVRVVDWAGGTRIGSSLKAYNDEWGRRGLTRGAVVLIASDGWEREDADLVGREMARLARAAHAVVWVNPLKGNPEYQPLAGGMRAALPYVDRLVSGHDLASLEALGEVLAGLSRRHAA